MKKKMVSLLMAALMTVGMLAGCGGNTNEPASADTDKSSEPQKVTEPLAPETEVPSEASAAEPVTLNVAYMPNYGSLWSIENAIAQGYFEEEGITVNLTQFQDGPTIIASMESGSIDIGYIGQGAHKLCIGGHIFQKFHPAYG